MSEITDTPICDNCGELMVPQYENNGFTPPEGAPHWEITCYKCPICGRTDEDQEPPETGEEGEENE